jgi:hypothetical protein
MGRCLDCYHLRINFPTPGWYKCRKKQFEGLIESDDTRIHANLRCDLFDDQDNVPFKKGRRSETEWKEIMSGLQDIHKRVVSVADLIDGDGSLEYGLRCGNQLKSLLPKIDRIVSDLGKRMLKEL